MPTSGDRRETSGPTIVLVHGFLGFARIGVGPAAIRYFRAVRSLVEATGARCLVPALPPVGRIAERAEALSRFLAAAGGTSFAIVGHSAGGLDARYLAARFDEGRRVRAVVTLATPHRGTSVAERILEGGAPPQRLLAAIGRRTLEDLTREAAARFNAVISDREDVSYFSYAGVRPPCEQSPLLSHFGRRLEMAEGENDGIVPLRSATWGTFMGRLRADHFELVGWDLSGSALPRVLCPAGGRRSTFDHRRLYREIVDLVGSDRR